MTLEEIIKFLESNKDKQEVKAFVQGLNPITLDRIKGFVGTNKEALSWLDGEKDKHHNKALETWKDNNLKSLIDEALAKAKANPEETAVQKEVRELKERLNQKEVEEKKQALKIKALAIAETKKLPTKLVEFFLGEDEEGTAKNLDQLSEVFTEHINLQVKQRLGNTYQPPGDDGKSNDSIGLKLAKQQAENTKMAVENQNQYFE